MKVKELYKKYVDYNIMLFGRPLSIQTIPFSCLPLDIKKLDKYIVKDMKIENKEYNELNFNLKGLKFIGKTHKKGIIKAYVVKE